MTDRGHEGGKCARPEGVRKAWLWAGVFAIATEGSARAGELSFVADAPEPLTWVMFALGLVLLLIVLWKSL